MPGNRFEYLEARAALDAIDEGELDPEIFRPGTLDVLAQHILAIACAGPFAEAELLAEIQSAAPYAGLTTERFTEVLNYIATGGYALKAYDKFRRLVTGRPWPLADHPARRRRPAPPQRRRHRRAADDGRALPRRPQARPHRGRLCLDPRAGDHIFFAGLGLEVLSLKDTDIIVQASSNRRASSPTAASG